MARNIILVVSTFAALAVLFVGYIALVGGPADQSERSSGIEQVQRPPETAHTVSIQGTEVPPGGAIEFIRYNEQTGRPTDRFQCQDWRWAPGSREEIIVSQPMLELLLPSGMIAVISANEGQLMVDRIESARMRPRKGWLAGEVRIVVDRKTSVERPPRDSRPEDLMTVGVGRLDFDLENGELTATGRLHVTAEEFSMAGSGLSLLWNDADNRVENLRIDQGEEFVLYAAAGLLSSVMEPQAAAPPADAQPKPAEPSAAAAAREREAGRSGYACTLVGPVVAEQYRGGQFVGGLQAEELRLLFDVGGAAGRALQAQPTGRAPATQPSPQERERLVVRWGGPLTLTPTAAPDKEDEPRRRFVAIGEPVILRQGEKEVRCGRVEYHDETQRVWLDPLPGDVVAFRLGQRLSASAASVYVDQREQIVKLIGDVELRSQRGSDDAGNVSSIRCSYWAELHVASRDGPAPAGVEPLLATDRLQSALFVGDVAVDLGGQKLDAHRLDVTFRASADEQGIEELLDTAVASGGARLSSEEGALECAQLEIEFGLTPQREVFPRHVDAIGAVVIARGRATISGNQVVADFAVPAAELANRQSFVLRSLEVIGRAELLDPESKVAARGERISAGFLGANRLDTATVTGEAGEFGLVHRRPFTVRGRQIELAHDAMTLHVDGPSRLSFRTHRSLQGERRGRPSPVVVTSSTGLHFDGRRNTARFRGDVLAASGDEKLECNRLTLLLEDVPEPQEPADQDAWRLLIREARRLVAGAEPAGEDMFDVTVGEELAGINKEPRRLVADDALVTKESREPGAEQPTVHASISAPLLEVDIVNRQIFTTGQTQLLLLNRTLEVNDEAAYPVPMGIPSALVTRGPSQTAMQCDRRMTYTLGPEGPDQRDTVLFEGSVVFAHRTGREMVNIDGMLPQLDDYPNLLDSMKSRSTSLDCDRLECWFGQDERATRRGEATVAPMELLSLIASHSVYMRDQEGTRIREVNAERIEFDQEQALISVRGLEGVDARVYFEDVEQRRFDFHAGQHIIINLRDGTIRSTEIRGQLRR